MFNLEALLRSDEEEPLGDYWPDYSCPRMGDV